ncbi:MAG TPA: PCRF domain-containing protein, partial [Saprospiraceae bacterium]|nr:PCRF domain-containing protein [Saprospiraceae bacterium]
MLDKMQALREKYLYLEEQLSDPAIVSDMDRSKKVNKEYKKLQPIMEAFGKYEKVLADLESARQVLAAETDPDMRELAREEISALDPERTALEDSLKELLTPKDPE